MLILLLMSEFNVIKFYPIIRWSIVLWHHDWSDEVYNKKLWISFLHNETKQSFKSKPI